MTLTPFAQAAGPATRPALIVVVLSGSIVLLCVVGVSTGLVRLNPDRIRRSTRGTALSLDATLSPRGRADAIEYLLDDQHSVVMEQEHRDGSPDEAAVPVLYRYPDDKGNASSTPD